MTGRWRLAVTLTLAALLAALMATPAHAATRTMGGKPFMIGRQDAARIPGQGTWQWTLCGLKIPGNEAPCPPPQIPAYADYWTMTRAFGSLRGRIVFFDQEGWAWTPAFERAHPLRYLRLAGLAARKDHVRLIEGPTGVTRPGATLAQRKAAFTAQLEAAARYSWMADIQDQASGGNPALYVAKTKTFVADIRRVSKTVLVMTNLGTDSGGFTAGAPGDTPAQSAAALYKSFLGTRRLVTAFWFELPDWPGVCDPAGCPAIATAFLADLGVTP